MPVSHKVPRRFTRGFVLLCLIGIAGQSAAESGIGVVEDPITRQYTERVYKDWQQGVSLDPASGNYIIVYKSSEGSFAQIIFEPATKISPTVRSHNALGDNSLIRYGYVVKNDRSAPQPIASLKMAVSSTSSSAPSILPGPRGWRGVTSCDLTMRCTVGWAVFGQQSQTTRERRGLAAGEAANSFNLTSYDLPGITVMELRGAARATTWLGEPPEINTPIGKQIHAVETKNYVSRLVVAPQIRVSTPFNAASVLGAIQNHIDTKLIGMTLIDPAFASELDRWLQAAIGAANLGNLSAVRSNLNEIHRLLEREHKGLERGDDEGEDTKGRDRGQSGSIDRLAAQTLSFDLKYVEFRLLAKADRPR